MLLHSTGTESLVRFKRIALLVFRRFAGGYASGCIPNTSVICLSDDGIFSYSSPC